MLSMETKSQNAAPSNPSSTNPVGNQITADSGSGKVTFLWKF